MKRVKLDGVIFETETSAEGKESDNATIKEIFHDQDGAENSAYGRIKEIFEYTLPPENKIQVVECRWFEQIGMNERNHLPIYKESTRVEWQDKRFQHLQSMCAENFCMVPNAGPDQNVDEQRPDVNFLAKP